MTPTIVAHRYARALMELASEAGQVSMMSEQLERTAQTYTSSDELRSVLSDPLIEDDKRRALLTVMSQRLGLHPLVQNALGVLLTRGRLNALPEIARRFTELADEQAGVLQASVASAVPLSDQQVQSLRSELERLTGCKIALEKQHEPALLAGVVARVGDHVIDASLRGRFEELAQKLRENPT